MSASASIVSKALEAAPPNVISPTVHGILDYAHAAFFFGAALMWRNRHKRAASAALATGAILLVEAALTDYRLGLKPVLPFAVHGRIDAAVASLSWAVPRLFQFSDVSASKVFEVNSMVEASLVRLTDYDSVRARR